MNTVFFTKLLYVQRTALLALLLSVVSEPASGQVVTIEGRVLLPGNGIGASGVTVWTKPCNKGDQVLAVDAKSTTYTKSEKDGNFSLTIQATGPFELRVDQGEAAMVYPRLSNQSISHKINVVLRATPLEKKLSILRDIQEAMQWKNQWNSFLPPDNKNVVRFVDMGDQFDRLLIPASCANLFEIEQIYSERGSAKGLIRWRKSDDGTLLVDIEQNPVEGYFVSVDYISPDFIQRLDLGEDTVSLWQGQPLLPLLTVRRSYLIDKF